MYHAPRFLSDLEMQRAINDEGDLSLSYFAIEASKLICYIETAAKEKTVKREEKASKNTAAIEAAAWAKNFQVYPAVVKPPPSCILFTPLMKTKH